MLLLIIFGLIAMFSPGWFMACIGIDSNMEEDGCLVWFFRIVGVVFVVAPLWFMISR
jgi:hypothetical protein